MTRIQPVQWGASLRPIAVSYRGVGGAVSCVGRVQMSHPVRGSGRRVVRAESGGGCWWGDGGQMVREVLDGLVMTTGKLAVEDRGEQADGPDPHVALGNDQVRPTGSATIAQGHLEAHR